jgi:hypothetical protein
VPAEKRSAVAKTHPDQRETPLMKLPSFARMWSGYG